MFLVHHSLDALPPALPNIPVICHTPLDNDDEREAADGTGALDNPGNQEIPVVGQQDSVYLGETLLPVPHRLVVRIRRGDYVDMGELLPEFWFLGRSHPEQKSDRCFHLGVLFLHLLGCEEGSCP